LFRATQPGNFLNGGTMCKAVFWYVPLGPLLLAVLLFALMPFAGVEDGRGKPLAAPRGTGDQFDVVA
jgi:hypothetical protein